MCSGGGLVGSLTGGLLGGGSGSVVGGLLGSGADAPDPAGSAAADARRREAERQARINSGMSQINDIFGQFDDDFYNQRRDAYIDYATPQLEDQYKSAGAALTAALSRSGNMNSSLAAQRAADLEKQYGVQRQSVADKARGFANQARESVSNSRGDVVQMLNASADPSAAVNEAMNRVSNVRDNTPSFDPLGPIFQNATSGLAGYTQGQSMGEIKRDVDSAYASSPSRSSGRTIKG